MVDDVSIGVVVQWLFENVTVDHTIHAVFTQETFTATFGVTASDGTEITDASITFNGELFEPGVYQFASLIPGQYDYTIERQGFFPDTGSLEIIDADVVVSVVLQTDDTSVSDLVALFQVYPNPASDWLMITAGQNITMLEIYDIKGIRVLQNYPDNERYSFQVSALPAGLYLLKVYQADGVSRSQRIVIYR